jgi:hypothetical protein
MDGWYTVSVITKQFGTFLMTEGYCGVGVLLLPGRKW